MAEYSETAFDVIAFVGIGLFLWSVARSFSIVAKAMARQCEARA
jgi:hypothetical protein